jgi:hypothetical protein
VTSWRFEKFSERTFTGGLDFRDVGAFLCLIYIILSN